MHYVLNYFETISLIQHMNALRVLFIPCAANNNCDDSIADNSCFVALNPIHHLLTPQSQALEMSLL